MEKAIEIVYEKQGRNLVETWRTENPLEVYKRLSGLLIAKKINQCSYIKSITRENNYTGNQTIWIRFDNGIISKFIVPTNI